MTNDELNTWATYHGSLFDTFQTWWSDRDDVARSVWASGLNIPTLAACKQASRELVIGDIQSEGGYTSHLKAVRARAVEISATQPEVSHEPTWDAGRQVYDCPHCLDTGTVTIWNLAVIADAIEGKTSHPKTCALACSCARGELMAEAGFNGDKRRGSTPTYTEGQHCEFLDSRTRTMRRAVVVKATDGTIPEKLAAIMAVATAYDKTKRFGVFDDYNAVL